MPLLHFVDKDATTGKTRIVAVNPDKVDLLYQDFAETAKTAIVCNGVTQWVNVDLAVVDAQVQAMRTKSK